MEFHYKCGQLEIRYMEISESCFWINHENGEILSSSFASAVNSVMNKINCLRKTPKITELIIHIRRYENKTILIKKLFDLFQHRVEKLYFYLFKKKIYVTPLKITDCNDAISRDIFDYDCEYGCDYDYKYDFNHSEFKKIYYVLEKIIKNTKKIKIIQTGEPNDFIQQIINWTKTNKKIVNISVSTNIKKIEHVSKNIEYICTWNDDNKIILDLENCINLEKIKLWGFNNICVTSLPQNSRIKCMFCCRLSTIIKSQIDINYVCNFNIEIAGDNTNNKIIDFIKKINDVNKFYLIESKQFYVVNYTSHNTIYKNKSPITSLLKIISKKKTLNDVCLHINSTYDQQQINYLNKMCRNNMINNFEIFMYEPYPFFNMESITKISVAIKLRRCEIEKFTHMISTTQKIIEVDITFMIEKKLNDDELLEILELLFSATNDKIIFRFANFISSNACVARHDSESMLKTFLKYLWNIDDIKSILICGIRVRYTDLCDLVNNNPHIINLHCDKYYITFENNEKEIDFLKNLLEHNQKCHDNRLFKKTKCIVNTQCIVNT